MMTSSTTVRRRGARRMRDVPASVLSELASGSTETVNLMEWLAVDLSTLARSVSGSVDCPDVRAALSDFADGITGLGITGRLNAAGAAVARACPSLSGTAFEALASHRSDLVRQWACFAANDPLVGRSLAERASATVRFAADANMSVREAAWMAFRPHLSQSLEEGLRILEPMARDNDHNVRRFAVEVSRPRSVWGRHIDRLKREPSSALPILEATRADASRYVQLAVGNWLNDASRTRPDWVSALCRRWGAEGDPRTARIVARGLRTIARAETNLGTRGLLV